MTSRSRAAVLVALGVAAGCGGTDAGTVSAVSIHATGPNVLPLSVNGAHCSPSSYPNKPCTSVTVCVPGTSTCQTIDDILVDTGSSGLRLFRQALTVQLPPASVASGALAECAQWGDSSSDWGPVELASVVLGGEPAVQVPIHVIDRSFGTAPSTCGTPEADPASAGFNGILGVGFFAEDCGSGCALDSSNDVYYACTGATCSGTAVQLAGQVQNPVSLLAQDGNGVVVVLPPVPVGGTASVEGQLLLGIATRSNNAPGKVSTYSLDASGYFTTTFAGSSYHAYADTGSNGYFFPPPTGLPACASPNDAWFCPASTLTFSATNSDAAGTTSGTYSFRVANFDSFANSSYYVSAEIAGSAPAAAGFDWGLPFHFGRPVFVGIEGKRSPLGVGPLVAY
jgi:hypothetical protein